jgi:outer membrane protein OmpA-like peptidoglycan-associated protein
MSEKRNRRRLFGKPLPNSTEEAAKLAEAAKAALAKQADTAASAGKAASSTVGATLSSAADKVTGNNAASNNLAGKAVETVPDATKTVGESGVGETVAGKLGEVGSGLSGRLHDGLLDINGTKPGTAAGVAALDAQEALRSAGAGGDAGLGKVTDVGSVVGASAAAGAAAVGAKEALSAASAGVGVAGVAGVVSKAEGVAEALGGSTIADAAGKAASGVSNTAASFKQGVAEVAGGLGDRAKESASTAGSVSGASSDARSVLGGAAGAGAAGAASGANPVGGVNASIENTGLTGPGGTANNTTTVAASGTSGISGPSGRASSSSPSGVRSTTNAGTTNSVNATGAVSSTGARSTATNTVVNTVKTTEWVPSRGKRALPLALGALGLVGLTGWQAFAANGKIEDNLRKQSLGKLKDEFPDLKVRVEGRDAYLEGTVADAESRKRAHDLVRSIKGVRHVKDPKVASPAPAQVAADAQVPLTIDTVAPLDTAADGMASIAEVTGDTIPETTIATPAVTTAAPAVAVDSVPLDTVPTTAVATSLEPTTLEPTTLEPTTLEPTTVVPASVLATSVPTTIVVAPSDDQPVATVIPTGEPIEPIRFGRASTDLEPTATAEIERIAAFLSANPNVEIGVAGYADSRGTKLQNMALAKVRAENVRQALIDRGVSAGRIKAVWFGDRSPVADNATEDGRAFNRRVEFRFFDAAIDAASAYGQDVSFTG